MPSSSVSSARAGVRGAGVRGGSPRRRVGFGRRRVRVRDVAMMMAGARGRGACVGARATETSSSSSKAPSSRRKYVNFTGFPFPLTPVLSRRTTRTTLIERVAWSFEQEQGIGFGLGVTTNVRMTVIRLNDGSLWVHDPIAPTEECVELLRELGGEVKYAVLSTTMYEHKIFAAPFQRAFKSCALWVAPGQFSFPLDLPNQFFGIFPSGTLGDARNPPPWEDEIESELLSLPALGYGFYRYNECAFFHKASKSVLITDAAVYVGDTAPEIIEERDLESLGSDECLTIKLLKFGNYRGGRNIASPQIPASERQARIANGWQRMALFSLFIAPDAKNILNPGTSFQGLANKFIVSPIVFLVVFQFYRAEVAAWARKVSEWDPERVIASHFPVPESASGKDFLAAFKWAETPDGVPAEYVDAKNDLASLNLVVRILGAIKAVPKQEKQI